jgi:glycosyltransferase involved in cell wall biosynthesis
MNYTKVSSNPVTENAPSVSIIIPFFNTEKYLPLCLDSALTQTFEDFEILAIDDGSSDGSLDIVLEYAKKDKRIHVFKNVQNSGVSTTANVGIANARGKYIARLDSDDMYEPNKLAIQMSFFEKNPDHVMVGGAVRIIDTIKNIERVKYSPKSHDDILEKIFTFIPIQHSAIMINRALIPDGFKWYDPDTRIAEDLDLIFRIAGFGKMCNLDDILCAIFERPESLSHLDVKDSFRNILAIRRRAIREYGYKLNFKSYLTMLGQKLIVNLTPAAHLFTVFHMIRKHI